MEQSELEALYRRYFPMLRQKCGRMLRDPSEAQDLAQEAFTRLWAERAEFHEPAAVVAWIYRTSTRLAIDRLRRRPALCLELAASVAGTESPEARAELARALAHLSGRLRARELEALILSRADGMTQTQIAVVLGTSERNVRRLIGKADECVQRWTRR
jgi:RNA polymerase sigma-70 factor (ECF subfamily)